MTTGFQIILSMTMVVVIFSPPMSAALTTFGKSNPQNPNPPPPPTPTGSKARECKMDSDCGGIQNTTCLADHRDGRTRCLCGDYTAPLNGVCINKFKTLRSSCSSDSECVEDAECVQRNGTGRRCYCREGFVEETSLFCNGCASIFTFYTTILVVASLVLGRFNNI